MRALRRGCPSSFLPFLPHLCDFSVKRLEFLVRPVFLAQKGRHHPANRSAEECPEIRLKRATPGGVCRRGRRVEIANTLLVMLEIPPLLEAHQHRPYGRIAGRFCEV